MNIQVINTIRLYCMCTELSEGIPYTIFFQVFCLFFWCLKFCPVCISILLTHIWILHKILGRIAPFLERFKKFSQKSKYPSRDPVHIYDIYRTENYSYKLSVKIFLAIAQMKRFDVKKPQILINNELPTFLHSDDFWQFYCDFRNCDFL